MKTNGNEFVAYKKFEFGDGTYEETGLTKREYFAAMAMQGLLATNGSYFPDTQNFGELTAIASVKYANALIKALNEGKEDAK